MHFPSCLIWSTFLVLGFPIAVPVTEEGNSNALIKTDQTPSGQYDANALNGFFDPLSTSPPPTNLLFTSPTLTNPLSTSRSSDSENSINQRLVDETQPLSTKNRFSSDTSTGSTLLAQNAHGNDIPGVGDAVLWIGGAVVAGWNYLHSLGQDVNPASQDDYSSIEGTNTPSKDDKTQQGGATTTPAGAMPQPAADTGETDPANPCPVELYPARTLAWCDSGFRGSVRVNRGNVLVWGYACTLFAH